MRITDELIEQTKQFLAEGLSQRRTARLVGISRGTVGAIAHGKLLRMTPRRESRADEPLHWPPDGPYVRCSGCGGKVMLPCLACHIRERAEAARRQALPLAVAPLSAAPRSSGIRGAVGADRRPDASRLPGQT